MKGKILTSLVIGLFILSSMPLVSSTPDTNQTTEGHIIEDVPFYPQIYVNCAINSLRMQLEYHGMEYSQSLLMNLGWNYGFMYRRGMAAVHSTYSTQEINNAAEKLGFNLTEKEPFSFSEAWEDLKNYLSQDKPVIIQIYGGSHTILAVGYSEAEEEVYVHEPYIGIGSGLNRKEEGAYFPIPKDRFKRIWTHYMAVTQPTDERKDIPWERVLRRNANLTEDGISDIRSFADDIESYVESQRGWSLSELKNRTFTGGYVNRLDISGFLQGLASQADSEKLAEASRYFRSSARRFARGSSLIESEIQDPRSISDFYELLETELNKIADYEEKAAEALRKGSIDIDNQTEQIYSLKEDNDELKEEIGGLEEDKQELNEDIDDLGLQRNILLAAVAILVLVTIALSYLQYKNKR